MIINTITFSVRVGAAVLATAGTWLVSVLSITTNCTVVQAVMVICIPISWVEASFWAIFTLICQEVHQTGPSIKLHCHFLHRCSKIHFTNILLIIDILQTNLSRFDASKLNQCAVNWARPSDVDVSYLALSVYSGVRLYFERLRSSD